jgi:hypothetical protein
LRAALTANPRPTRGSLTARATSCLSNGKRCRNANSVDAHAESAIPRPGSYWFMGQTASGQQMRRARHARTHARATLREATRRNVASWEVGLSSVQRIVYGAAIRHSFQFDEASRHSRRVDIETPRAPAISRARRSAMN